MVNMQDHFYFSRLLLSFAHFRLIMLDRNELRLQVDRAWLLFLLQLLRNCSWFQFRTLSDLYCVDYPDRPDRFEVVYLLHSYRYNYRIRVSTSISAEGSLPSVSDLFRSAGWLEREVWDLYGVFFSDHPDLRRLLSDYGFSGFPLRKEFPLTGFYELRYDELLKRVVEEPVELSQDYRQFDFLSPWKKWSV